jgi:predicted ATPase
MRTGLDGRAAIYGRRSELVILDGLVAGARAGQSQVIVLRGEAGIGKTALLDYVETKAAGCRVARAAGVEAEMELPYAGLHQLCGPFLDRLTAYPIRNASPSALRSASSAGTRRIASWSGSRCWTCSRTVPRSGH